MTREGREMCRAEGIFYGCLASSACSCRERESPPWSHAELRSCPPFVEQGSSRCVGMQVLALGLFITVSSILVPVMVTSHELK